MEIHEHKFLWTSRFFLENRSELCAEHVLQQAESNSNYTGSTKVADPQTKCLLKSFQFFQRLIIPMNFSSTSLLNGVRILQGR